MQMQDSESMNCDPGENGVCSESINGGRDVWSSKDSDSPADHLVVMANGILGR